MDMARVLRRPPGSPSNRCPPAIEMSDIVSTITISFLFHVINKLYNIIVAEFLVNVNRLTICQDLEPKLLKIMLNKSLVHILRFQLGFLRGIPYQWHSGSVGYFCGIYMR